MLLLAALGVLLGVGGYTFVYARGYSYLLDEPLACVNCHVMRDNYNSWIVSSHRHATCNDCHVPHDPLRKYLAKGDHGFRHSWAFTFEDVQVIRITAPDRLTVQQNCIRCHEMAVGDMLRGASDLKQPGFCTRCHRSVGHVNW